MRLNELRTSTQAFIMLGFFIAMMIAGAYSALALVLIGIAGMGAGVLMVRPKEERDANV